jgi:hypothetical protein
MRSGAVAAVAALALWAGGCAGGEPGPDPAPTGTPRTAASAACAPVEHPPEESGGHLLPGATPPVPYGTRPPTSGWHASGLVSPGVHTEPLTEPQQVAALEGGRIVVTWRGLPNDARGELEAFAGIHANRVVATPYDAIEPGQVAFTAWGVLQRCRGFDPAAAAAFLERYAGRGPTH